MLVVMLPLLFAAPAQAAGEPLTCEQIQALVDAGFDPDKVMTIAEGHGVEAGTIDCLEQKGIAIDPERVLTMGPTDPHPTPALPPQRPRNFPISTHLAYFGTAVAGGGVVIGLVGGQTNQIGVVNIGALGLVGGVITLAVAGIVAGAEHVAGYEERRLAVDSRGLTLRFGKSGKRAGQRR